MVGEFMTQNQILIGIILISSCFFMGTLVFSQGKWIADALLRGCVGVVMITLANQILGGFGLYIPVGVNGLNFVVTALLGVPGVISLYGIGLWQIFF